MPAAIPAIVAYGAVAAAEVATGTILAGTFTGALIGGGAAMIASYALAPDAAAPDIAAGLTMPGSGRTQQFRQPTPSHEVVVGRIKKSGPIMFVYSGPDDTGRADGYFYAVHALAAHHCKAIGDVFIDADFSTDAKFTGLVRHSKYLGTTGQIADPDFVAETAGEWTADHRLRGRTVLYSRLKGNAAAFPTGIPNISAIVWGADEIIDPRTGIAGWTNNAILIAYWWMVWGEGYDAADFDTDTLIANVNICDERIRVLSSTTTFSADAATDACTLAPRARSLDVGDGVRVSTSGTLPAGLNADQTYYAIPSDNGTVKLAGSVAAAFAGTVVDITSAGTGTQTLIYWDEARYKLNGTFTLDAEKRDVRDQLLTACGGYAVEIGGMWFLHAAAAATPTVELDEDDLRAAMVTVPKRSMRDRWNGVRAIFVNPDNAWQPGDAPPLRNATYVAADNGVELYLTTRFPFTTSARTVQRLEKILLERNRMQRTVKFPAKLSGMQLRPVDGCYISNARYGWDLEQMQVMGWALSDDGGIDLQLQEDSAAVYAWDHTTDEQTVSVPQDVVLPDPSVIAAPASVTVALATPTYANITATWDEVSSIWLDGYDAEYRDAGGTDWTSYGRVGATPAPAISVERTTPQDFQVRSVTTNGATSAFTQNMAPALPTGPSALGGAGKIDLAWTNGAGSSQVQIFEKATNDFATSTLLATVSGTTHSHTGLGVSEQHFYWLRSLNAGGNISEPTGFLVAVTDP